MRKAFADTLYQLATNNPKIILLTGDLGYGVFDNYQEQFPDRFINVGICEQAMVDIAAGLALEGYKPIIYSIASFLTGRAWEQIKISLCYQNLPVVVVGAGGGYSYSTAGTSHHAPEDLGLMSLLPGMTVTAPGCPSEVSALLPQLVELKGPSYMRIGRYGEPEYEYIPAHPAKKPKYAVKVGKAVALRNGQGATIVTTGDMASKVLDVVGPQIWHFPTIKPLDTSTLSWLPEPIIVVEECSPSGGLYAAIMATGLKRNVVRVGPKDEFLLDSIDRDTFHQRNEMDVRSIQEIVYEALL